MASRPPRVTSRRPQRTTRGGPVVTSRQQQPTTPRSIARWGPSWYRPPRVVTGVPSAAQGATASTAAVNPYSVSNLPPDASWLQTLGLLQKQRDENVAAIAGERTRTLSDYGFKEGPNGALTFDPNNPFSKASLLKKTYDTNRRATGNSMAAGGRLYQGAFQNAQDLIGRNQLQAQDAQLKALQAFLASNTGRRKEALTGYEFGVSQADADRIARFQSNPLYDPASGQWKDPNAGGGGGPAPTPATVTPAVAAQYKVVNGKRYRKTASGKWMLVSIPGIRL